MVISYLNNKKGKSKHRWYTTVESNYTVCCVTGGRSINNSLVTEVCNKERSQSRTMFWYREMIILTTKNDIKARVKTNEHKSIVNVHRNKSSKNVSKIRG